MNDNGTQVRRRVIIEPNLRTFGIGVYRAYNGVLYVFLPFLLIKIGEQALNRAEWLRKQQEPPHA